MPLITKYLHVHLMNEAPKIGSGHRFVVALIGRLNVKLVCPASLESVKMSKTAFASIERTAIVVNSSNKKIAKAIRAKYAEFEKLGILNVNKKSAAKKALAALRRT